MNDVVPRFTRPFGYVQVVDEDLEVGGIIAMVCQGWRGGRRGRGGGPGGGGGGGLEEEGEGGWRGEMGVYLPFGYVALVVKMILWWWWLWYLRG